MEKEKTILEGKIKRILPGFITPESANLFALQKEILTFSKAIKFYEAALAQPEFSEGELEELRIRIESEMNEAEQKKVRQQLNLLEPKDAEKLRTKLRPVFTALLVVLSLETFPAEQKPDLEAAAKVIGQIRQSRAAVELEQSLKGVLRSRFNQISTDPVLPCEIAILNSKQIKILAETTKVYRGDREAKEKLATTLL